MCPSLPATVSSPHVLLDYSCLYVHEVALTLTAEHCNRQLKALLLHIFTTIRVQSLQYAYATCGVSWQLRPICVQAGSSDV